MINNLLINKYNVAAPRYTSYPTVPLWEVDSFDMAEWCKRINGAYTNSKSKGISVYVHLPFCESLCTYCGCNTRITKNHSVEIPYIEYLLKEWGMYKKLIGDDIKISELHFGGGTPTFFAAKHLQLLVEGLLDGAEISTNASFSFEAHPANTTKEHLETLYKLGFRRLSLGIQDFDPKVQLTINRHQTVGDVERVVNDARAIGYSSINFDLIYGLPFQTLATVSKTIDLGLSLNPDRISFYSYAHVPWIKPGQRRFTEYDLPTGKEKLDLYLLGKQMIEDRGYHDVGMDHFAKPDDTLFKSAVSGTLHRNFMGYTDLYSPLLIGLGVSSIGDTWDSFGQNVKTLEEYYKCIDQGQFPIFKGHLLTDDDLGLRRYILEMMCKGHVELDPEKELSTVIKRRLEELVHDQIVVIDGDVVKITKAGKPFLRNVCMTFDERLHNTRQKVDLFSQSV